jgi:excisionase family DNA binding protein
MHTHQAIKPADPDALLDQIQVAKLLRVTTKFLEARRVRGGSIPYIKVGRLCRYRRADVEAWIESQRRTSTSESRPAA